MYVQRMDVRYVFEQITDVCWKLYGHMDRQELFNPRETFCKNVLLGLKLRPCGISSPLKFKGSKFVDELHVWDFNGDFNWIQCFKYNSIYYNIASLMRLQ